MIAQISNIECGNRSYSPSVSSGSSCTKTSKWWNQHDLYAPSQNAKTIFINVNEIIIQRHDGTGNFGDPNEPMLDILSDIENQVNSIYANITNPQNFNPPATCNSGYVPSTKIQFVFNRVFYRDPTDKYWDRANCKDYCCPDDSDWLYEDLDKDFQKTLPPGINVYFSTSKNAYEEYLQFGTSNDQTFAARAMYSGVWCSEQANKDNLDDVQRIHQGDTWMKHWWFKYVYTIIPYSQMRWTHMIEAAKGYAHELGHSFQFPFSPLHIDACGNHHVMSTQSNPPLRDYFSPDEVNVMHEVIHLANTRKYVACTETYGDRVQRVVASNETWDMNTRLYQDVVVKTGATLKVQCLIEMPVNGKITVERGARLILDGGTITSPKRCGEIEHWYGIVVEGNTNRAHTLAMRNETYAQQATDPGIVLCKGGLIEHSIKGITTDVLGIQWPLVQQYWNGVIVANGTTFRNNKLKSAEFMKDNIGKKYKNVSRFYNCTFEGINDKTQTGVTIWASFGVEFELCTFKLIKEAGVIGWDAKFDVKNTKFDQVSNGIHNTGTMPMTSSFTAIDNEFKSNLIGIYSMGVQKSTILNNLFSNTTSLGVYAAGESNYLIKGNAFASTRGIANFVTGVGSGSRLSTCNSYTCIAEGIYNQGKNTNFGFDQESFFNNKNVTLINEIGTTNPGILSNLGSPTSPVGNIFMLGSRHNIRTLGTTSHFTYFYPKNAIISGSPELIPACDINKPCSGIANNFTSQASSNSLFDSDCIYQGFAPTSPNSQGISNLTARIQQAKINNTDQNVVSELEFERGRNFQLFYENNYQTENGLNTLKNFFLSDTDEANPRYLFALYMQEENFAGAENVLNVMPVRKEDDVIFKRIQRINLERLKYQGEFQATSEMLSILEYAVNSNQPSSIYAKSLLNLLRGDYFPPSFIDSESISRGILGIDNRENTIIESMIVAPNPTTGLVTVILPSFIKDAVSDAQLIDLQGAVLKKVQINKGQLCFLDISDLKGGIYMFVVIKDGAVIAQSKVLKVTE